MSSMSSYGSDHHDQTHSGTQRKRVGKACDRCRIKKSKCNGDNPCDRCNTDDQVCTYSERRRPRDKNPPRGYIETLESRCIILTQGLIEMDRIRKGLPPSSTQFIAGRPSGRMANSILKEIGIDTSRIETDFDDYDGLCGGGSPGAESLGGGSNHSQYDEFFTSTEHLSHPQSHHSPASSRSPSVNAASSRTWPLEGHRRQESHGYPVANSQFVAGTAQNLVSSGDYQPPMLLMEGTQYQPSSPAPGVFHYNQDYNLSSQDLPSDFGEYYEYNDNRSPTGSSTNVTCMEPNYNFHVQGYA